MFFFSSRNSLWYRLFRDVTTRAEKILIRLNEAVDDGFVRDADYIWNEI